MASAAQNEIICKDPDNFKVTEEMVHQFDRDGYILVRGLFSPDEMKKIEASCTHPDMVAKAYFIADNIGKAMKLSLWKHPGNDILGMVARCRKLVDTSEKLLRDEVYHYHTKIMMKDPHVGGRQVWHQDYGYWYQNGCLYPNMLTAFIAVDESSKENGCLQVVRGSHKIGRIQHHFSGGQTGADMERINQILQNTGLIHEHIEQKPGDALIFHCNLLHVSDPNESAKRRYMLSIAYNTKSNNPVYEHHHPQYVPLSKVENSEIMKNNDVFNPEGKEFVDPSMDKTVKGDTKA